VPTKPRVYMDSCCFIELALHSIGDNEPGRENDIWHLTQLLNAAHDGEIEVLTSILSVAECTHARGIVTEDVKTLFKRFLTSGQYLFLIQDTILVAERARNLRWVHNLSFGGADSIHLASAMELRCDEFLTFDGKPHAYVQALDSLALRIRFPRDTQCLPGDYRQQPLIPSEPPPPSENTETRESS